MFHSDPFSLVNVNADSIMRGVTLALPIERVRDLLPAGLELGEQKITPGGTHPVTLFFNDMFRVKLSIPTLFPAQSYREHIIGIPFTYLAPGSFTPGYPGPYYYMPKLYLDNLSATLGGLLFWGFPKEMGTMSVTADRYAVSNLAGQQVTSLAWQAAGEQFQPIAAYPLFEPIRQLLSQPNISLVPAAAGPFFIRSDFDRDWDVATIQPVRTAVTVDVSFVPGYPCNRYPNEGWAPGIDESGLGSYVLRTPWRLSVPYPPLLALR